MPNDPDFPDDCDDSEDPCPPDPERDQDTLTDALAVIDDVELTDADVLNGLTPFKVKLVSGVYMVRAGANSGVASTVTSDGLSFKDDEDNTRTIEWGHHDDGERWHTHRVSFDGRKLVTVT